MFEQLGPTSKLPHRLTRMQQPSLLMPFFADPPGGFRSMSAMGIFCHLTLRPFAAQC